MYLKRLELQGFKSFLTRTVFEFSTGVTAVIGPNGSGKSNVAESLRWVLGEQHSRNIRARRLEDVIFSGSSQKAAVGMAEVSITLDNSEGWLPVDYSEVVVSRRAYRNGDSEYLINKNKVRLRDVLDLFMKAQVGQNSYAFMGQGLVEEVLVMRPEERRRLLEEAADVRLLRTRLDEARDRLSATRENLERVTLLIDEIGPRLKQLERQAARAADHERLARELSDALKTLYGHLWAEANESLAAASAGFDQRMKDLEVARRDARACEDGLAALSAAIEERQKELSSRRNRERELSDARHRLNQQLSFDRERVQSQAGRHKELEDEIAALRIERADLLKQIDAARQRETALRPEIEEARGLITTRRQELNSLEQEYSGLRRRVAESEDRMQRSRRLSEEAAVGLDRLANEEARVQADALRRVSQRRELLTQLADFGVEFLANRRRLAAVEREAAEAYQERAGLLEMVEYGRAAVFRLESEAIELGARLAQMRGRQELLLRLQSAQEGVDHSTRMLIGAQPETQAAEGLIGLLRDIIRVPPGLERAIEAALAENVQALVFENLSTAMAAIEALEREEAGRALIYPLDMLRATPPANIMRERGVVGLAARLVRCDGRFRPLVDTLLGRTIVVEDFGFAQQVVKRGMGSVVTMNGILVRPGGALSGGVTRAAAESFSRQRDLDEIPGEISLLESQKYDMDARLRREKESHAGAAAALSRVEPRLQSLRDEVAHRQSALIESRGRLVLLRSEARGLWADLRRSEGAHTDWRQERDGLRVARDTHAAAVQTAADALTRDREALNTMATRRNAAVDAVSEAAAAHADLEGEARSMARQAEMMQASLARAEAHLKGRDDAIKALDRDGQALRDRIATQTAELAALEEQLATVRAELAPATEEFQHLAGRERSMREQLNAARSRLLQSERAHMESEGHLKLKTDELASLRESMTSEGFPPEEPAARDAAAARGPGREGLPPVRGGAAVDAVAMRRRIGEVRGQIRSLGPINEQAPADYTESKERYDFLRTQVEDLDGSEQTLLKAIDELEGSIRERLKATFEVVDAGFQRYFEAFFAGGKARLSMTNPEDFANSGLDMVAQPPGKRVNSLAMLSGGERALTAVALLLALLQANPSPICVLDEVDAALDEANVGRFVEAVKAMSEKTQFVIITHNPRTIEAANVIYGVSMGADNTSKVLSLRLGDPLP